MDFQNNFPSICWFDEVTLKKKLKIAFKTSFFNLIKYNPVYTIKTIPGSPCFVHIGFVSFEMWTYELGEPGLNNVTHAQKAFIHNLK